MFDTKNNVATNMPSLFSYSVSLLKSKFPDLKLHANEFGRIRNFFQTFNYNPLAQLIGDVLEDEIQTLFEKQETKNEHYLSKLLYSHIGERGVMISFDEDENIKKAANKKANGISLPDYIFITRRHIIPADIKTNLSFAKEKQVSAKNLRELFSKIYDEISYIFNDLKIEGRLIQRRDEVKDTQKQERKASTPMQILGKKGVPGSDMGKIGGLWRQGKSINEDDLRRAGVSHSNLGLIVNIFNGMLGKK